jgi:hypothetical protein
LSLKQIGTGVEETVGGSSDIDDSATEQKEAFVDMEPPVPCLLCTVHSQRILIKKLSKFPALQHMICALAFGSQVHGINSSCSSSSE